MPSKREWGAFAAVLALGAWTRLTSWPQVLGDDGAWPLGGDACYHLRRAMLTRTDFPTVPVHDPLMNWPDGAACHWPGGFDLLLALPGWLLGLSMEASTVAALAVPVLLGLVVLGLTWVLARALLPATAAGRGSALLAPLLLVALPQAVSIARFGRTDHHVAEAVSMALLGMWALAWRPGRSWRGRLGFEAAATAIVVFALATFAGAVLYLALACVLLGLAMLPAGRGPLLGSGAPGLLAGAGAVAALYGPGIAQHGRAWSYAYPSWLQPALVGVAALGVTVLVALGRLVPGAGPSVAARRAGLALAAAGLALGGLALTPAGDVVRSGLGGFVGRQDPWLASIAEFQPLIRWSGGLDLGGARTALAGATLLVPVALAGTIALALRDPRRWGRFAAWMVLAFSLALLQMRFARVAHVVLAVGLAGIVAALGELRPRLGKLTAVTIAAASLVGGTGSRELWVLAAPSTSAIEQAAGFLDLRGVEPQGDDGALAPWDYGHFLSWGAGRPVGPTGFGTFLDGDAYAASEAAWGGAAEDFDALLTGRRMGHAVLGAATFLNRVGGPGGAGPFVRQADGTGALNPEYFAALPVAATILAGSGLGDGRAHHLPHLRPVFASTATVGGLPFALPVLFVFERVPGAKLAGRAPPGTTVALTVPLEARGQAMPWVARTVADEAGAWALTIPVATGEQGDGVATASAARLGIGAQPARAVRIPLAAVRGGLPVPVEFGEMPASAEPTGSAAPSP